MTSAPNPFQAPATPAPESGLSLQEKLRAEQLSVGELVSLTVWALLQRPVAWLVLLVVFYLPQEFIALQLVANAQNPAVLLRLIAGQSVLGFVTWMAIAAVIGSTLLGESPGPGKIIFKVLTKLVPVLLASVFYFIGLMFFTALLIVPGVIFFIRYLFVTPAIVIHDEGIDSCWSHASSVVRGRWWRVAGILVLAALIPVTLNVAGTQLLGATSVAIQLPLKTILDIPSIFMSAMLMTFYMNLHYTRRVDTPPV